MKIVKIPTLSKDHIHKNNIQNKEIEINKWFGDYFHSKENRYISYDYIENFIKNEGIDWTTKSHSTLLISNKFQVIIKKFTNEEFAFLLCHTGYIPETYKADSSQETLYSKLVEVMVSEWAFRMGFCNSTLPTQKSSKEDVTISDGINIIVADAKSYRLGRSQPAPNVKDALKKGDIKKWLSFHENKNKIGGLIAFPSQHDWKNGSDFYLYLTDKYSPITMLFYEHMAFMLLNNMNMDNILSFFQNHEMFFPNEELNKNGSRKIYFDKLNEHLLNSGNYKWGDFSCIADFISSEKATYTLQSLREYLKEEKNKYYLWAKSLPHDELVNQLADIKYQLENNNFIRQVENIINFRKLAK